MRLVESGDLHPLYLALRVQSLLTHRGIRLDHFGVSGRTRIITRTLVDGSILY